MAGSLARGDGPSGAGGLDLDLKIGPDQGERAQAMGLALFAKRDQRLADRYGADRLAGMPELLEEIAAAEVPAAVPQPSSPELASA
jgi:hypothetical protein